MVWYADTPHCLSVRAGHPYRVRRERTPTSSSAIWSNRELATPGLESDRGDQLMVDAVIAALVRDVEHLAAELIGVDGLTETTLLIGDARHVQYAAAVHHAARRDGGGGNRRCHAR